MQHKVGAGLWMAAPFLTALALSAVCLAHIGWGADGVFAALRLTARFSFFFFWLAYTGGALAKLFGPAFALLPHYRREFGLSFAAVQLVHTGLIVWFFQVSPNPPLLTSLFVQFEIIGLVWVFGLAAISFKSIASKLSPHARQRLFTIGVEYIALDFFFNFVVMPVRIDALHLIEKLSYLPFTILAIAGPIVRWTAKAQSPRPKRG